MKFAFLTISAGHDLAWIETSSATINVDLAHRSLRTIGGPFASCFGNTSFGQIIGIASISFITNAIHIVVVCNAK